MTIAVLHKADSRGYANHGWLPGRGFVTLFMIIFMVFIPVFRCQQSASGTT